MSFHSSLHMDSSEFSAIIKGKTFLDLQSFPEYSSSSSSTNLQFLHSFQEWLTSNTDELHELYTQLCIAEDHTSTFPQFCWDLFGHVHDASLDLFVRKFAPAPRLVCIEPNPGPILPILGGIAGALGSSVLSTIKKKARKGVSKAILAKAATAIVVAAATKKKSVRTRVKAPGGLAVVSVSAPVSTGIVHHGNHKILKDHTITIPINAGSLGVYNDGSGNPFFKLIGSSATTGFFSVDLTPFNSAGMSLTDVFGPEHSRLSSLFAMWKLNSLEMVFESALPTSQPGIIQFAYSADPYIFTGTTITPFAWSSGMQQRFSGPVYYTKESRFRIRPSGTWKYMLMASPTDDADQRLCNDGTLIVTGAGITGAANAFLGVVHFNGSITYKELSAPKAQFTTTSDPLNPLTLDVMCLNASCTAASKPFGTGPFSFPDFQVISSGISPDIKTGDGRLLFTPGIYRLRLQYFDVTGTITTGATYVGGGSDQAVALTTSSSSPPYPYEARISAWSGTTGQSYVDFTGPTGMTSGNVKINILKIG